VAALTEVEARTRAGLPDVDSYEVFLDLTVQPVRSLADREPRTTRRLARLLYPATLVSPATVAATDAALQARHPGGQLRVIVQEQQAILRSALAARSTARRLNLS